MTQPQDPRQTPLQDDEIALARVLRALPAGEPPAHLDAAILKAASDAVAVHPGTGQPRRTIKAARWLPTWAIGTAAAAVLAVGIGLQLRPPLAPEARAPAAESSAPASAPMPEREDRLSVELIEAERAPPPPTYPPPLPQATLQRTAPAAPPPPPPEPAPLADAAPAMEPPLTQPVVAAEEAGAFAPPPAEALGFEGERDDASALANAASAEAALDQTEARDQAAAGASLRARRESAETRQAELRAMRQDAEAQAKAEAPAAAAPMPAPAPAPATTGDAFPADAAALPPVSDDARLAPREWIQRIRDRLRQGDRAGARASLQLYLRTHPQAPVPTDLDRLR